MSAIVVHTHTITSALVTILVDHSMKFPMIQVVTGTLLVLFLVISTKSVEGGSCYFDSKCEAYLVSLVYINCYTGEQIYMYVYHL